MTDGKPVSKPNRPANEPREVERTLDDPTPVDGDEGVGSATACRPDVCELGTKRTKWAGLDNLECPRCGYATIDMDAARARNPQLTKEG